MPFWASVCSRLFVFSRPVGSLSCGSMYRCPIFQPLAATTGAAKAGSGPSASISNGNDVPWG